ncbi:MAG: ATP-binding protein [Paludibacter sp.]|nr:ATP-binding protein [Paludibacter sp.]
MIAEFRIKNFLSIKTEQCLSFEASTDSLKESEYCIEVKEGVRLLKTAIIYGANASGKSNILFALSFFRDLMINVPKGKTEEIDYRPFLLDETSLNDRTEFSMTFYLDGERFVLSIVFDKTKIFTESLVFYPSVQPAKLYTRTYNEQTDSTDIEFGSKLGLTKKGQLAIIGNTINNCSVLAAFGKSNVELSRLNVVYDFFAKHTPNILGPSVSVSGYIKRHLDKDKDNSIKTFLIEFLKASDFNISGLELKEDEEIITPEMEKMIFASPIPEEAKQQMLLKGKISSVELMFKHQTDNGEFELPEELESMGTIRFMGMAIILRKLLQENSIVSIDEIESSLHYELLSYFIKVFLANSDKNSQLLMTTHDVNLLNEDFIRRDSVWFTDKDGCGETHLIRLSSLGLHKNLSPYNAYKQGKLVKLPFLGSIYLKGDKLCDQR